MTRKHPVSERFALGRKFNMSSTRVTSTVTPASDTAGKVTTVRQFKITDIPDAMDKHGVAGGGEVDAALVCGGAVGQRRMGGCRMR